MRFARMTVRHCSTFAVAVVVLIAGLVGLTGCGYINPQQTTYQYAASDGIHAEVGPAKLRNILIVASDENQPGRVIGAIYNSSPNDITVSLNGTGGAQAEVAVEKNSYTLLNESTDPVILSTAGGQPGSLVDITITEDETNMNQMIKVPVLDGTLPEYAPYLPGGQSTPSPGPTSTSTQGPAPAGDH